MADKTLRGFPASGALATTTIFPVQSPSTGAVSKATLAQLLTLVDGNAAIAESQVTGLVAALVVLGAIALPQVQCSGDSITFGYGLSSPSTQSYPAQTAALLPGWMVTNQGISGDTIVDLTPIAVATIDPLWSWRRPVNICGLFAGTNDSLFGLEASLSNSTIIAALQANTIAFHQARHAAGYATIGFTMIDRNTGNGNSTVIQEAFNTWYRATWPTFTDGLCDLAAIGVLGNPGASLNTTYFLDGAHMTAAGNALAAAAFAAAILEVCLGYAPLASPVFTGTVTAPSFATTGSGAGVVITRRDTSAPAYQWFSAAGVLSLFGYAANGNILGIDGAGNFAATSGSFTGSIGLNGTPPPAKAAAPTLLSDVITILRNLGACS